MVGLKNVLVQGFAALLFFVLLTGALVVSLNSVFGKPTSVESSLAKSGIYSKLAGYAVDRAAASTSTTSGSVSLDDPKVKAIANSVFSEQLVQQNAETFINGNYRWLDGTTSTPQFTVDLTSAKNDFATKVGQAVLDYLSSLPVCTAQQLVQLKGQTSLDPLTIPCRPSTVQSRAEATRVGAQILSSNFLTQPVLTAQTINVSGQNNSTPYYQQLAKAPRLYQLMQTLPLILGVAAVLLSLGVIFVAPIRRRGVRRVGLTFVVVGMLLIATKFVSDNLFARVQNKVFTSGGSTTDVQKPLLDAAHQLQKQLVQADLFLGIGCIVIGLILVFVYFKMRAADKAGPRSPLVADTTPKTVNTPAPVAAAPQPAPAPPVLDSPPVAPQLARPAKGPTMDIAAPTKPKPQTPKPTTKPVPARRPPRARGRLVQ